MTKVYKEVLYKDTNNSWYEFKHNNWNFYFDVLGKKVDVHYLTRKIKTVPLTEEIPKETVKRIDLFLDFIVKYLKEGF